MLRITRVSDWTGPRTRLVTNVPALGEAAYLEALKMGLEPHVTTRYNGFHALEFVGSEPETTALLAELPPGLLELARATTPRQSRAPRRAALCRTPLTRAQEWERALALISLSPFSA